MFFNNALLVAVSLSCSAFAALPSTGIYHIVNQQTGNRFDVEGAHTAPGTPILGYPPNTGLNQRFNVVQVATEGSSGIYVFTAEAPVKSVYANAQNQGNGLTAESYAAPFNVTETPAGFSIAVPRTNPVLAVTTPQIAGQLTLQPLDATNNAQIWAFQVTV